MGLYDQIVAAGRAVADDHDAELAALQAELDVATAALSAAHTNGAALAGELAQARAQVVDLQHELAERDAQLAERDALIADLREQIRVLTPDPFVLGQTEPTAANTGCRIPRADLLHRPGTVTSTHPVTGAPLQRGDVISGVRVSRLAITVPGVVVRDVWVDGGGLSYGPNPGTDYHRLVDARACPGGASDDDLVRYEHVTVDPATRSYLNVAFQGSNFRAYRCLVVGVTDAFSPHSTGSQVPRAVDILGCYAADFYIDADPNQSDGIVHGDFVQSGGKLRRLRIEGNAVAGGGATSLGSTARPRTSNVLLQTNAGAYSGEGVSIVRNWLRGHPAAGSTVNVPVNIAAAFELVDNVIASTGKTPRLLINAAVRAAAATAIANNVLDTGAAATVNNS